MVFDPALPPGSIPLVPYADDEDDEEEEIKVVEGPLNVTPCKRRSHKLKELLETEFLRCSKRLNQDVDGFKDAESAHAEKTTPTSTLLKLLLVLVSCLPPPNLFIANIQGITTGFLQIQRGAISEAVLTNLLDDEE